MPHPIAYLSFDGNCAEAMRFYEQALGGKSRLELLEAQREIAESRRLDGLDVELERTRRLVQVQPPVRDDPQACLRLEHGPHPVVAEPDALELVAFVLQAEVGVTGARDGHSPDLAFHP